MSYQNFSKSALVRLAENGKKKVAKLAEKSEKTTAQVTKIALTAGAAYGVSALSVKLGGANGYQVKGVPIEALVGAALVGAGMLGAAGKQSEHLMAIGEGALYALAAKAGAKQGATIGLPAGQAAGQVYQAFPR